MIRTAKILAVCLTALSLPATAADADWMKQVAQALGKPGTAMAGDVYRVGLARSDLKVTLDGVQIKPALALGSWVAFTNGAHGGAVMGDLVLLATEVAPVMNKLEQGGIDITALHNHLLRNEPFTMYMHIMGHGDPAKLAGTLRAALLESKDPALRRNARRRPRRIKHRPGHGRHRQNRRTPWQGQRWGVSDEHSSRR